MTLLVVRNSVMVMEGRGSSSDYSMAGGVILVAFSEHIPVTWDENSQVGG